METDSPQEEKDRLILSDLRRLGQFSDRLRSRVRKAVAESILDELPEGVVAFTVDGRFIFQNDEGFRLFGAESEDISQWLAKLPVRSEADRIRITRFLESVIEGKRRTPIQVILQLADGENEYSLSGRSLHGAKEERVGGVFSFHNIEAQIRRNRELRQAKDNAEQAAKAKMHFIANVSHEIRTPMTSIMGYADALVSVASEPEVLEQRVQIIQKNCLALLTLIDDILDIARVESDQIELRTQNVDLQLLLEDVFSLLSYRAEKKGLKLQMRAVGSFPLSLRTDGVRVRQVLINLLGNSLKFTHQGTVEVTVGADDGRQNLVVEVVDTGRGIPKDSFERIFGVFSQADSSTTRQYGGSGLGLALSRRLCQALGGDLILVESQIDKGSRFRATIPIDDPSAQWATELQIQSNKCDINESELADLREITVLVVEDSPENRELFRIFLETAGARVLTAENGKKAVEVALGSNPDIVLMDIQMPEMDGYEAVSILRRNEFPGALVALTAHAMADEVQRCEKAGFDSHLSKPISAPRLTKAISVLLGLERRRLLDESKIRASSEKIRSIYRRAVNGLTDTIIEMREEAAAKDWKAVGSLAHRTKGLMANCGFLELADVASKLETTARDNPGSIEIFDLITNLERSHRTTRTEFLNFLGE